MSSLSIDSMTRLDGHVAVVTGSSLGMGRATALELARGGADVVVHCRARVEQAQAVAQAIEALGRRSTVLVADLSDAAQHEQLVADAWSWQGRVDTWINNAGVDVLTGELRPLSFDEKLERLWRVDVVATMRLTRLVGARMQQHAVAGGAGPSNASIINLGWDQAETGMEGDSGQMFSAIKAAVMAFTRSAARSFAPHVRVNCIAPGWIRTAWGEQASDYWQQRAVAESLLRRWGEADDVARTVRFLASPAAAFITAATLPVNGGR